MAPRLGSGWDHADTVDKQAGPLELHPVPCRLCSQEGRPQGGVGPLLMCRKHVKARPTSPHDRQRTQGRAPADDEVGVGSRGNREQDDTPW